MPNYAVPGETLTGIANAIRSKTGSDEQMTVSAMAAAIEGIPGGGEEKSITIEYELTSDFTSTTEVILQDNVNESSDFLASIIGTNGSWTKGREVCIVSEIECDSNDAIMKRNIYSFMVNITSQAYFSISNTNMSFIDKSGNVVNTSPIYSIRCDFQAASNAKNGIRSTIKARCNTQVNLIPAGHYRIKLTLAKDQILTR